VSGVKPAISSVMGASHSQIKQARDVKFSVEGSSTSSPSYSGCSILSVCTSCEFARLEKSLCQEVIPATWVVEREELLMDLFALQDLDNNGLLEEAELIKLNQMIARLHYGEEADLEAVRARFSGIFRARLAPEGEAAPVTPFCNYMRQVLHSLDPDDAAQEMILEQLILEAKCARSILDCGPMPVLRRGDADSNKKDSLCSNTTCWCPLSGPMLGTTAQPNGAVLGGA